MKLTYEMIHACASNNGGWNKTQLSLLGVSWPPVSGWLRSLVDKEIEPSLYAKVLALRGVKPKEQKRRLRLEKQGELTI